MDGLRVVIADDQLHFRRGLRAALESSGHGIEVVGEAADGREAVALALEHRPDVVLLDIRMPGGVDGLQAAEVILTMVPDVRVLMLTISDDPADVEGAVAAGASGYLLKERSLQDVVAAVSSVAAGARWPVAAV
jgi:DNA-binding NarL/FixJ family response regulator